MKPAACNTSHLGPCPKVTRPRLPGALLLAWNNKLDLSAFRLTGGAEVLVWKGNAFELHPSESPVQVVVSAALEDTQPAALEAYLYRCARQVTR